MLQGVGGAFVTANSGAVIAELYPPERRGKAFGWNSVGWNSVGWNSVGWNSVGWNSVGWNTAIWEP